MESSKTILFTGGTGFLGSFLSAQLLREGYTIYFLVRPKHGEENRARIIGQLEAVGIKKDLFSQVHVVSGDITKPLCGISNDWISEHRVKVSAIWHIAGLVSFHNRQALFLINVDGTKNALEIAERFNVPFHYISTAYVAGNSWKREILEDELQKPPSFLNVYEESKYEAERIVRESIEAGRISATIYRPSIIMGHSLTGQAFSFSGYYMPLFFFYDLKKIISRRKFISRIPIIIPYVRKATLNLIQVDHAVRLISSISQYSESRNKTFHIVHPSPPQVKFVFDTSLTQLGYSRLKFIRFPRLGMKIIRYLLIIFSYVCGNFGKKLRRKLVSYFGYLVDTRLFSTKNVQMLLGEKAYVPVLDKIFFQRCINYAIKIKLEL